MYSFTQSGGNDEKCPFCKADMKKTDDERVGHIMKRVEANDAGAICQLGCYYNEGTFGLLQDRTKAIGYWTRAAELFSGCSHCHL